MAKSIGIAALLGAAVSIGCGGGVSETKVAEAQAASYQGDLQTVMAAVVEEVKKEYPNVAADGQARLVKTAWHPIPLKETVSTREENPGQERGSSGPDFEQSQVSESQGEFLQRRERRRDATERTTRYFVRFDIRIEPQQAGAGPGASGPWKVTVTGQASEYDGTTAPMPLKGAERPYWLDTRIKKLEVAIYDRLEDHRVEAAAPPPAN